MEIGMIVYSLTGHTLRVARTLKDQLTADGHSVNMEQVEIVGPAVPANETAALKTKPSISPYDGLVFCSPVRGGMLPPPVKRYFEQLGSLEGKRIAILVTGFFPARWGRERVIAQMRATIEEKGGHVGAAGSVGWFSLNRGQQIKEAVRVLSQSF